jgi:hypothetical protein
MKTNKNVHYFWRLLLHVQQLNQDSPQGGYAMLMTSIVSILVFSMLSVYLFSANLYKSVATSVVDSGTTFYAAEHSLNRRAYQVKLKFEDFGVPTGTSPAGRDPAAQMQTCMDANLLPKVVTSNDFECRMTESDYIESVVEAQAQSGQDAAIVNKRLNKQNVKYHTYSFVNALGQRVARVPTGEPFAGLNMIENTYRVYTTAAKEAATGERPKPVSAQTMLQMDFNDRWIPLFQFVAFYQNDLEVTSSPNITLNGPVHTNSNLRLAPGGILTFNGRVTASGNIFKGLGYTAGHFNPSMSVQVTGGGTAPATFSQFSVAGAWVDATNNAQITAAELADTNGQFTPGSAQLTIPPINNTDRTGNFYSNADVRVNFDPSNLAQPFQITALKQNLPPDVLRSLSQPVVFLAQNASEQNTVCQNIHPGTPGDGNAAVPDAIKIANTPGSVALTGWTLPRRNALLAAMQTAIASEVQPIAYNRVRLTLANATNFNTPLYNGFYAALPTVVGGFVPTAAERATIDSVSLSQIAKLSGSCIVPAPMQVLRNQLDRRENRPLSILQTNINSIVAWNRDGQYSTGGLLVGGGTANKFFKRLPAGGGVPNSYQSMGLASLDTTDGGLGWHFSLNNVVDNTAPVNGFNYNVVGGIGTYGYRPGQSSFGFGFSGASKLPGALSVISDQAIYTQGNYNITNANPALDDKKPAAVMADTITILSNLCLDNNAQFNCFNLAAGSITPNAADSTEVNAAFLSRTDVTTIAGNAATRDSGGVNNYMRALESWTGQTLLYRGSFVSVGAPVQFSGQFLPGRAGGNNVLNPGAAGFYYYMPPIRNFGYDTSFNNITGLPPMTPSVNFLKQKVFRRDYNSRDRLNS